MSTPFNPQDHLIGVAVRLFGPSRDFYARLALDTGASSTLVSKDILVLIGYDSDALPKTVKFTTGSGVEAAPRLAVDKIEALDQERLNFSVVAHNLPPTASVDGVLGLDFFRNHILTLDFQNGEITLA
jgi:predicted aspartyl protease